MRVLRVSACRTPLPGAKAEMNKPAREKLKTKTVPKQCVLFRYHSIVAIEARSIRFTREDIKLPPEIRKPRMHALARAQYLCRTGLF